jgi:copper chaperone CopZ
MADLGNPFRRRRGDLDTATDLPESGNAEPVGDVELQIPDMVCERCAEKLEDALHAIDGVREVRPNVRQKRVRVRYEVARVHLQQLKDAVSSAGFSPVDADLR